MARSAARAGPSNTLRPTQTQRTRGGRRQAEPVSEDEAGEQFEQPEDPDENSGDEMEVDGNSEISQKVNDLVRLALFMEYKRTPLKREDINKKVLAPRTRSFNTIFSMAQQKLRDSFGMELVELPSRTDLEQESGPTTQTQTQDGPLATGIKKRATTAGSKTYMLRSCLDPLIIEHAAQTLPKILEEEVGDQGTLFPSTLEDDEDEEGEEDGDRPPKFYGSLISWSRADQLGSIGILYVILALVLANNRVMPDGDLRRYLKALRLTSNPAIQIVKFNATSTVRTMNLDGYLSNLLKQGYLDRQQVGVDANRKGKRGGIGSKRLRTQAEDLEEGRVYEWRWGPRAHCEVGEQNVGRFVAEFMIESAEHEEEAEGVGRRVVPKKREELVKKMYTGFEKAAGGHLRDLK